MTEIKVTDVLVIASGGAGCRAALEAFQLGAKVTILCKGAFGKSGTTASRVADTAGYNVADAIVDEGMRDAVDKLKVVDRAILPDRDRDVLYGANSLF